LSCKFFAYIYAEPSTLVTKGEDLAVIVVAAAASLIPTITQVERSSVLSEHWRAATKHAVQKALRTAFGIEDPAEIQLSLQQTARSATGGSTSLGLSATKEPAEKVGSVRRAQTAPFTIVSWCKKDKPGGSAEISEEDTVRGSRKRTRSKPEKGEIITNADFGE
jgi:hypothetical protein